MDIAGILGGLKDKVLDAAHFELLKNAYQLQEQNIDQLKSNNEAHKERVNLLHEKIEHLEKERDELAAEAGRLRQELTAVQPAADDGGAVSDEAAAVLVVYATKDATTLDDNVILQAVEFGNIELEAAISELVARDVLRLGSIAMGGAARYSLTDQGTQLLAAQYKRIREEENRKDERK